jgi:hypothetical protein
MHVTWGSCRRQQPQAVRRNRVAVFMRLQCFVEWRSVGVSRVAVLSLVPHSVRYSLVRFNRDVVVSDSQGFLSSVGYEETAIRPLLTSSEHDHSCP